ncbi:MAG: hypothetical protein Q7T63_02895 [Burkholderiaceae bacterium]|nr:hypothetical protein [Burkholderiaceae bacterium]
MNQRLLWRYGIPAVLLLVTYASVVISSGHELSFVFALIGAPIATLWIFWLIAHEPPAVGVSQKRIRIAAVLLILGPPLALLMLAISVMATDDTGLGMFISVFFVVPWVAIQAVAGVIALWRVTSQKLAPSGTASAPNQIG